MTLPVRMPLPKGFVSTSEEWEELSLMVLRYNRRKKRKLHPLDIPPEDVSSVVSGDVPLSTFDETENE
jgi:hypothetical protein